MHASTASAPEPQRARRRRGRSRTSSARYESALVKQEQAVHPAVDAVEEQHPARGDEHGRDEPMRAAGEPRDRARDQRAGSPTAKSAETSRSAVSPPPRVRDDPGEQEVQRRAAALAEHDVERAGRASWRPDEERERLVLVRRPRGQPARRGRWRRRERAAGDARGEAARRELAARGDRRRCGRSRGVGRRPALTTRRYPRARTLLAFAGVPIYEYQCPNGHVFEVFQRMTDPPPEVCEVCGAAPARARALPGRGPLQGLGLLLDRLRRARRRRAKDGGKESSDAAGDSRVVEVVRLEVGGESKSAEEDRRGRLARPRLAADAAGAVQARAGRRRLRRRDAQEHQDHVAVLLARRSGTTRRRSTSASPPSRQCERRAGAELDPAELQRTARRERSVASGFEQVAADERQPHERAEARQLRRRSPAAPAAAARRASGRSRPG